MALESKMNLYIIVSMNGDGNNNNPNPDDIHSGIHFDSKDIERPNNEKLFVRTRKRFTPADFFVSLNKIPILKGWRKFALLGFIWAAIIAAVITIVVINANTQSEQTEVVQDLSYTEVANAIYKEAIKTSQGVADTAYFDALAIFDKAIAEQDDETVKNEIIYSKAEFYHFVNAYDEALSLLEGLKGNEQLNATQQAKVFSLMINIYQVNCDTEKADELLAEYNNLYPGGK